MSPVNGALQGDDVDLIVEGIGYSRGTERTRNGGCIEGGRKSRARLAAKQRCRIGEDYRS